MTAGNGMDPKNAKLTNDEVLRCTEINAVIKIHDASDVADNDSRTQPNKHGNHSNGYQVPSVGWYSRPNSMICCRVHMWCAWIIRSAMHGAVVALRAVGCALKRWLAAAVPYCHRP